jgi:chromosome segregation ATPase
LGKIDKLFSDMKMPSLADLKKTKDELELALAELDNIERATRNIELAGQNGKSEVERSAEEIQLKQKVEFLEQSNKELAEKNDVLMEKFKKVNSEKDSLKKDINALRDISKKLQVMKI